MSRKNKKSAQVVAPVNTAVETVDLSVAVESTVAALPATTPTVVPETNGKRVYRLIQKISKNGAGQTGLIQKFFDEHPEGGTAKQITEYIRPDLKTVQDPLKVVMFYMITGKKSGKIITV